jgi:hypothetical protein
VKLQGNKSLFASFSSEKEDSSFLEKSSKKTFASDRPRPIWAQPQ